MALTLPTLAVMTAIPALTAVSNPLVFTVATLAFDELHVAEIVTFACEPSL
jgi:hypothetical protein